MILLLRSMAGVDGADEIVNQPSICLPSFSSHFNSSSKGYFRRFELERRGTQRGNRGERQLTEEKAIVWRTDSDSSSTSGFISAGFCQGKRGETENEVRWSMTSRR